MHMVDLPYWPGTNDCLPCHAKQNARATDNCFAFVGAHQCGVLMDALGWLAAYVPPPVQALVVSTKAGRSATVYGWALGWRRVCTVSDCEEILVWLITGINYYTVVELRSNKEAQYLIPLDYWHRSTQSCIILLTHRLSIHSNIYVISASQVSGSNTLCYSLWNLQGDFAVPSASPVRYQSNGIRWSGILSLKTNLTP